MKKKKNNFENGFTLAELLVGMSIFSLILVAVSGIFVSALRSQKRALASMEVSGQTSYLMEHISRALRMAKKDDVDYGDGVVNCLSEDKTNYETTTNNGIRFRNYKNECQEFYLDNNTHQLMEKIGSNATSTLTSPNLRVNYFNVNLLGEGQTDYQQPRVTIAMEIATTSSAPLKIQTTVSQRQLDFVY